MADASMAEGADILTNDLIAAMERNVNTLMGPLGAGTCTWRSQKSTSCRVAPNQKEDITPGIGAEERARRG